MVGPDPDDPDPALPEPPCAPSPRIGVGAPTDPVQPAVSAATQLSTPKAVTGEGRQPCERFFIGFVFGFRPLYPPYREPSSAPSKNSTDSISQSPNK